MDLRVTIRELYAEKRRLEEAIASLEELLQAKAARGTAKVADLSPPKRRGRKSMPPEERRIVSQRMKKYWATRRAGTVTATGRSQ